MCTALASGGRRRFAKSVPFLLLICTLLVAPAAGQDFRYNLPHIANGEFTAGSIRTTFVFFNEGGTAAEVAVKLASDEGGDLAVAIAGFEASSELQFQLAPHESRFLETDGKGELQSGSARATSDHPIGVSAIFSIFDEKGSLVTEAGISASRALSEFAIAVDATGDFNTGIALQNPHDANLSVRFTLFDQNGNLLGETVRELAGHGHLGAFVAGPGGLFPESESFRGKLVITSPIDIAALTLRQKSLILTTLPVHPTSSNQAEFILPHIANGGGIIKTTFVMLNCGTESATARLSLSNDQGEPLVVMLTDGQNGDSFSFDIPAGGVRFVETNAQGTLMSGAASVVSNLPIGVSAVFSILDAQGKLVTEAGVGDSPQQSEYTLPVDLARGFDTGVAFFNSNSNPVNIELELFPSDLVSDNQMTARGMAASELVKFTLGAHSHEARFVSELFSVNNKKGFLAIRASDAVSALTLRQNISSRILTTLPQPPNLAAILEIVSSASLMNVVAPDSLATISGVNLAKRVTQAEVDHQENLPLELDAVTVKINGRLSQLLSVSPNRIDFVVPPDTEMGEAEVIVSLRAAGLVLTGSVAVTASAPGLFPLAVLRPVFGEGRNNYPVPLPIDNSLATGAKISPYVTGIPSLRTTEVKAELRDRVGSFWSLRIDAITAEAEMPGKARMDLRLPAELQVPGFYELQISVAEVPSNSVNVYIYIPDNVSGDILGITRDQTAIVRSTQIPKFERYTFIESAFSENAAFLFIGPSGQLPQPVLVDIFYGDKNDFQLHDQNSVFLYHFDERNRLLGPGQTLEVDREEKRISFFTDRFSDFMIAQTAISESEFDCFLERARFEAARLAVSTAEAAWSHGSHSDICLASTALYAGAGFFFRRWRQDNDTIAADILDNWLWGHGRRHEPIEYPLKFFNGDSFESRVGQLLKPESVCSQSTAGLEGNLSFPEISDRSLKSPNGIGEFKIRSEGNYRVFPSRDEIDFEITMWGYNRVTFNTGVYNGVPPPSECGKVVGDRRGACIPFPRCELAACVGTVYFDNPKFVFVSDKFGQYMDFNRCSAGSDYDTESSTRKRFVVTRRLSEYRNFSETCFNASCEDDNTCAGDPTFIQHSQRLQNQVALSHSGSALNGLFAEISVPYENSLVRAQVPIFGVAHGKAFKDYRVDYGKGSDPTEWMTIATSSTPQVSDTTSANLDDSTDLPIKGNLATWDTGLTNYVYPPVTGATSKSVDLKGVYTLRLTVSGEDGRIAEDQVTVEVGNVIPNAWGGVASSEDDRAELTVPEHALTDLFRVVSVKAVKDLPQPLPDGLKAVGPVYEFRPAGEPFLHKATLRLFASSDRPAENSSIYGFDTNGGQWHRLSTCSTGEAFSTQTDRLYPFAVLVEGGGRSPTCAVSKPDGPKNAAGPYLSFDTFNDGSFGMWANLHDRFGASLSLDANSHDGTAALKLTNQQPGGSFGATAVDKPFDVGEFPMVRFDYRITPDVKIDFLAKVEGRWYLIGFTGEEMDLAYKRTNLTNIGRIAGVRADGQWHQAEFDLRSLLRRATRNPVISELIMASWSVPGYMKLGHGANQAGATFWIDNFGIWRSPSRGAKETDALVIDNYEGPLHRNNLGGEASVSSSGPSAFVRTGHHSLPAGGRALELTYDVASESSWAAYSSELSDVDLGEFQSIQMRVRSSEAWAAFLVGLRDSKGDHWVTSSRYVEGAGEDGWKVLSVPLVAFGPQTRWAEAELLIIAFKNRLNASGVLLVDDIHLRKDLDSLVLHDFEDLSSRNNLGGGARTESAGDKGQVTIDAKRIRTEAGWVQAISYGGNIGKGVEGIPGLGWAVWLSEMQGVDCSQFTTLSFRIRGERGGERPNIYLDDGNWHWAVNLNDFAPLTTSWQTVEIPLRIFAEGGVDLTHLEKLKFAFEWEAMSGTIYLDDIRFQSQSGSASHLVLAGGEARQ